MKNFHVEIHFARKLAKPWGNLVLWEFSGVKICVIARLVMLEQRQGMEHVWSQWAAKYSTEILKYLTWWRNMNIFPNFPNTKYKKWFSFSNFFINKCFSNKNVSLTSKLALKIIKNCVIKYSTFLKKVLKDLNLFRKSCELNSKIGERNELEEILLNNYYQLQTQHSTNQTSNYF